MEIYIRELLRDIIRGILSPKLAAIVSEAIEFNVDECEGH